MSYTNGQVAQQKRSPVLFSSSRSRLAHSGQNVAEVVLINRPGEVRRRAVVTWRESQSVPVPVPMSMPYSIRAGLVYEPQTRGQVMSTNGSVSRCA